MFKHTIAILYIERTSFSYYAQIASPVTFKYPAESFNELEVTNEELFVKSITEFITSSKLVPASFIAIFASDLLYEKEYIDEQSKPQPPKSDSKSEVQIDPTKPLHQTDPITNTSSLASHEEKLREINRFIESVPFEETLNKTYKIDKGIKVVVANKRLFYSIKTAFTRQGFLVEAAVPLGMLGKEFGSPAGISDDLVKKLFLRYESLKENNLLQEGINILGSPMVPGHIQMTTKVQSKREYTLIGVFLLLIIIAGVYGYFTFMVPAPSTSSSTTQPQEEALPIASQEPSFLPSVVASPSAEIDKSALRITISGGTAQQANGLREVLAENGFTGVTIRSGTASSGRPLVVFSTALSSAVREMLLAEIRKVATDFSVQENNLSDADILINL